MSFVMGVLPGHPFLLVLLCGLALIFPFGHADGQFFPYKKPSQQGMKWYDNAKFGLFIHWAPVSQWGDELSWPLSCPELPCELQGFNGTIVNVTTIEELATHRRAYYALAETFNPQHFDPDEMAHIAKRAGFKYMVFTTEHCDGFCNFNTSLSDYNVLNTPFGKDTFGLLSKAFKQQDIKVGAYLCPSLWNNDKYWAPNHITALAVGCFPNYNPQTDTHMWEGFLQHLHGQVKELITKYQPDLFWFDCVSAPPALDYRLSELAPMARAANPNVVLTQREEGLVEDFVTSHDKAEDSVDAILGVGQMIAGHKFEVPSVMDEGGQWGYSPYATYKSAREIVQTLVRIVAKGGNYLINLGPGPDGRWAPDAVQILKQIGDWMDTNSQAIHDTQPMWPYEYNSYSSVWEERVVTNTFYVTGRAENKTMYATILSTDDVIPEMVIIPFVRPSVLDAKVSRVDLLGVEGIQWEQHDTALVVRLPLVVNRRPLVLQYAFVYKITFI